MTARYLWTLERNGRATRTGFDTASDLEAIIEKEDLPGAMPLDWIVQFLQIDADREGVATHASPFGSVVRMQRSSN